MGYRMANRDKYLLLHEPYSFTRQFFVHTRQAYVESLDTGSSRKMVCSAYGTSPSQAFADHIRYCE